MSGNSIFVVSGRDAPNAIERLDLEGDEVANQEVIGYTDESVNPVLLEVSSDFCV